jgi:DNA (cytosine-5)-methyltransferase 1
VTALTATDLFCGAGGSSLGAEVAGVELKMAANHWPKAIDVHQTRFPDAGHDCADISQVDPRRYPATNLLLASPECTNHSNAKGVSRKAQNPSLFDSPDLAAERSRATMWDVPRFVEAHRYDAVVVENVVDAFVGWIYRRSWWQTWEDAGYEAVVVNLNSAHTGGVHQWRDRVYVVAVRRGLVSAEALRDAMIPRPPCWCPGCDQVVAGVQTFKKAGALGQQIGKWRQQYLYRCPTCRDVVEPPAPPAAAVIDWTLPAGRIGDRAKPLAANTLERIRRGLAKYGPHLLAAAGNTWDGVNTGSDYVRAWPLDDPTPVQACRFQHAIAHPDGFVLRPFTPRGDPAQMFTPDSQPIPTQTTACNQALVIPNRTNGRARPGEEPLVTMTAGNGGGGAALLMAPQSDGRAQPSDRPSPSMTTKGTAHLIVPYNAGVHARPATEPHGTLTTRDREAVVEMSLEVDDCLYRMLDAHEVQAAMAFPADYLHGVESTLTKSEKVKLWGNAVTPPVMTQLVAALRPLVES